MELEALEEFIATAFGDVPPPPLWCLANSREGVEPELLERDFRDKRDWRLLTPEFLDWAPDGFATALHFFSDEALRFYLPAYLLADLRGQLSRVDVLFHLTHGLEGGSADVTVNPLRYGLRTWRDEAHHRFSIYDARQARAIAAFLQHKLSAKEMTDFERRFAEEALANYWLPRAETGESTE